MRPSPARWRRYADRPALFRAAADEISAALGRAVRERGVARWALAGGETPAELYRLLAGPPWSDDIPWHRLEIFWGDERCVPPDHPASNYHLARAALLDRVPLRAERIHRIHGELPPAAAAAEYAERLGGAPLDLVLLGMGADGHTASLFPGGPGLAPDDPPVVATQAPVEPRARVSLALRTLNASRIVYFLVVGAAKSARVAQILGEDAAEGFPAARVRLTEGTVTWFLDAGAARRLPDGPRQGGSA